MFTLIASSADIAENKKRNLFLVLSSIFITNTLIAELAGSKIFSLEATLGFSPAQIVLFSQAPLDFNLTTGVIIWPVVFISTDIINEYFGRKGVRKITLLTSLLVLYAFALIWLTIQLPPAKLWVVLNQEAYGEYFDINQAFQVVFTQSMGIIIGSLSAFLVAQFVDVVAFQKLRKITGSQKIWLRATGSTLISQLIDSFVVLIIAFYVFGTWQLSMVFAVAIVNYIYKFLIAVGLTPLLYLVHYLIDSYLGQDVAKKMTEEASQSSF